MCYEINLYESVKKPKVKSTITTDALFEIIRSGGDSLKLINRARQVGKQHIEYQDIKTNLPAVTWNFLFDSYKIDKNIINSTGLIYYDIDVVLTKNLNTDYIFAKYQSLSNVGSTIIVKVSGVTINNFSATYCAIANKLGITDLIDSNASKRTQFNVISYDPNIFINNDSFCFSAETIPEFEEPKLNTANENQKNVKWRYDNYADYCKENDTQEYEFGVSVVSLYLPSTIKNGKRKHTLLSYCNNLVLLNPMRSFGEVFSHLLERNIEKCTEPLDENEIKDIVTSILKYKNENKLKFKYTRTKKIFYGRKSGLTVKERQREARKTVGCWQRNKTKTKIYNAIERWDSNKKITIKEVSHLIGMSVRTVKTYWTEFKEFVKEENEKKSAVNC